MIKIQSQLIAQLPDMARRVRKRFGRKTLRRTAYVGVLRLDSIRFRVYCEEKCPKNPTNQPVRASAMCRTKTIYIHRLAMKFDNLLIQQLLAHEIAHCLDPIPIKTMGKEKSSVDYMMSRKEVDAEVSALVHVLVPFLWKDVFARQQLREYLAGGNPFRLNKYPLLKPLDTGYVYIWINHGNTKAMGKLIYGIKKFLHLK